MIKQETIEATLVTAQGTLHTLTGCKPGRMETASLVVEDNGPAFDPFVTKQVFEVSVDSTLELHFDPNPRLYNELTDKGLGWGIFRAKVGEEWYEWQIFVKEASLESITFLLMSRETRVMPKPDKWQSKALSAIEIFEDALRHLQMEAGDAGVSWVDDESGRMRYQPLTDYVDWVIKKAKDKAKAL
jgi:hypothetical protein